MSALVVSSVFYVVLAAVARCDTNLQQVPSYHKESSTTFLRLTALRDDEGLWIARFGEYEISIELKHHHKSALRKDVEDTWTLKIKHTPKPFQIQRNVDGLYYNNEVPVVDKSSKNNKNPWKRIFDAIDNDAEDANTPIFNKFRRSAKSKKGKSRRQLSPKSYVTRKMSASITPLNETVIQPFLQEPPILKQVIQGNHQLGVAFNRLHNDTSQMGTTDEAFQELNETPWDNVAAVMLDSVANHTLPVDKNLNQQTNQKEIDSTESSADRERAKLMEPRALPLEQSEDREEFETDKGIISLNDTRGNEIVHARNYNKEAWNRTEGLDSDDYDEGNARNSTESAEAAGNLNGEQHADNESDYVIKDPTVREYDKEDVELENNYDNMGDGRGGSEPTSEMKRIMDWFPRSKLLTTENNGYKLFPGVGWFKLITWPERWSNAQKVCKLELAHLAVPDTRQRVRVFLQILKNYPDVLEQAILQRQVYVGVHSSGQDRNFSTVLGKPFLPKLPIWFPNEPDNADPGEDCVTFHAEGKIRDVPCFYNLPFLCEKELQ